MYEGMTVEGCIVYPNSRVPIPSNTIDKKFEENLEYFISIIDTDVEPPRVPSESECAFCKISSEDCPERIEAQTKAQEGVSI